MQINQQLHPRSSGSLGHRETILQTVLRIACAGPDSNSREVCPVIPQDLVEFHGLAVISKDKPRVLEIDHRAEIGSMVLECIDGKWDGEPCQDKGRKEPHCC